MKKILVIEDTENVRENIIEILETEDYEVHGAENGRIGLEVAANIQPDLVLCDIMMPEMDGYETLKQMRENVSTSTTPFIFLTAKNTRQDQRAGMELGADDYIPKPFTMEELLGAVSMRLKRSEEFIQKSEEKLNELTKNMGTPITEVINEPLKAIVGFSKMLMTEYSNMEKFEMAEFNQLIYKAGMKLNSIVGKSFLYYQLEALALDKIKMAEKMKESSLNIKSLAENRVAEVANDMRRTDDIIISLEDTNLQVPADYFLAVITEIVENAFLYSPKRTAVRVIGGKDGDQYIITVRDEGLGMTQEQISKIGAYQKFQDDLEGKSGVGLGLNNSKKVVELFGGSFLIKSSLGMDTTVRFSFPVSK
ncbi:response regulator [Lentimicrobium sp. L6]|uniref:hybrid sensor histidine kinase/response regulator n=1 Tax=Lentimicrobium sp. L6 TaxID=2735916 RepID=UPI0015560810|nr:response regulator [Lentimicrobium sp. L6]NPD84248.1 response regulator [Lentimicrobium sp. L6]